MALAFYFHDRYEFKTFCDETKFLADRRQKMAAVSLYNVQHAPATMQFSMDFSEICNSDSEDGSSDSDMDDEYVFI